MNRFVVALLVALLLASAGFVSPAYGEEDFDPTQHVFEYVQPDNEEDVSPEGWTWADISWLSMSALDNGTVLVRMDFVDFSNAVGEVAYVTSFTLDGQTYQAGVGVLWAAGVPLLVESTGWQDQGDIIGTPGIDTESNTIFVWIEADEIAGLEKGSVFTDIEIQVGAVVVAVGSPTFHDTLEPSLDPVDFTYLPGPPEEEDEEEGPEILFQTINEARFRFEERFDTPTNLTLHYNWTNPWENLTLKVQADDVASGNAAFVVTDASGDIVFGANLESEGLKNQTLEEASLGDWQIIVQYNGFQGTVSSSFQEYLPPDPEEAEPADTEETGTGVEDESTRVPSTPVLLVVLAVMGSMVLARLRRP